MDVKKIDFSKSTKKDQKLIVCCIKHQLKVTIKEWREAPWKPSTGCSNKHGNSVTNSIPSF